MGMDMKSYREGFEESLIEAKQQEMYDGETKDKIAEGQFTMADLDKNMFLDRKEFDQLFDYYTRDRKELDSIYKMDDGKYDWRKIFDDQDYNKDGFTDMYELGNAMLFHEYDLKMIERVMKAAEPHLDKEGKMSFEHYMMLVEETMSWAEEEMGGRGPRMEIHMEENADGSSKMTIIMESAKKLAVSATALAAMAFFAN